MELIQVADTVAREKNIDKEVVLCAMEEAIQKAGRSKYGHDFDIRAEINRRTGEITLKRFQEVCDPDEIENESAQIPLEFAKKIQDDVEIGDYIVDELPPLDFGRIAAQTAKQVILQKVREAERKKQFEEFKDRTGEIINGLVKRVEYGNVTVDIGKAEAVLRRDEVIPRENFRPGDRVRALILDVREETRGPQIFLSRSHPDFLKMLFTQEVPEIYDGIIEIKNVARDPGSRAKMTVTSREGSIDPVGACVGMRGSRVQAVVAELQGEKIDIIPHTEDTATLAVTALQPAQVSKVVMDEDSGKMEIVVPEEHLSLAIGRRGQNVRLASMLTGWDLDVMTEEEEASRRAKEFETRSGQFIEALDIDEVIAHLLVAEGFVSVRELAETPIEELNQIEGFEEEISTELRNRAINFLNAQEQLLDDKREELGIEDDLIEFETLGADKILILADAGIKTLDDLADLASDELVEIFGEKVMTEDEANEVIMKAREHWFAEEDSKKAAEEEAKANSEEKADGEEKNNDAEKAENAA